MVELLRARDLRFSYPGTGSVLAVDGVSIDVEPGELLVVLGPNGSGKSTLLRLLAGLLRPDGGESVVSGSSVSLLKPRERARRIALVPQLLRAPDDLTVRSFVLWGRYGHIDRWRGPRSEDFDAARAALVATDAVEWERRALRELSGGMQQRVSIARALAQEAPLLLVDEPTTSLDPEHQLRVFDLLAKLVRAGRGAVVVTHDLNLASQFATRVVLLEAGRTKAEGTPSEVLRPEVLEPVYGPHFWFGQLPHGAGEERPCVVPWLRPN